MVTGLNVVDSMGNMVVAVVVYGESGGMMWNMIVAVVERGGYSVVMVVVGDKFGDESAYEDGDEWH